MHHGISLWPILVVVAFLVSDDERTRAQLPGPTPASLDQWPCRHLREQVRAGATARFFADVSDHEKPGPPRWVEFPTAEALSSYSRAVYTDARVWTLDTGLLVVMWFSSPSGDWSEVVEYCFRADGTVAQIETSLSTFYADPNPVERVRRTAYRRTGEVALQATTVIDVTTKKILTEKNFQDSDPPLFQSKRDLPFWQLLRRSAVRPN